MSCEFNDNCFVFKDANLTCRITTTDEDGNVLRPTVSLSREYNYLIQESGCEFKFTSGRHSLTIYQDSCNAWCRGRCDCQRPVKFESNLITIEMEYGQCKEAIKEFLKQFEFRM